jgi:hypothetical protein
VAEQHPLSETLLDLLVYAPLGAAVVASEELPRLAARGRERFERQLGGAELMGRLAVAEARRRLGPRPTGRPSEPVSRPQAPLPAPNGVLDTRARTSPRRPTQRPLAERVETSASMRSSASSKTNRATADHSPATTAEELPIPAYDTLAASQVVERLASLTPAELEAVRKHESAARRRRTVLHRIAQLNAGRDGATS